MKSSTYCLAYAVLAAITYILMILHKDKIQERIMSTTKTGGIHKAMINSLLASNGFYLMLCIGWPLFIVGPLFLTTEDFFKGKNNDS